MEESNDRNAGLVFLWKWLTKLVLYPAMFIVVVAGRSPESGLGKVWGWLQRRIARLTAQAPSADAVPPAKAMSARASISLWVGTSAVAGTVFIVAGPPAVHELTSPNPKTTLSVRVPATAAIFAAGQTSAPDPAGGGTLPPGGPVTEGDILRFDVTGTVACQQQGPFLDPDGGQCSPPSPPLTDLPPLGAISGIVNNPGDMYLVGVFTNGAPPVGTPPPTLDFSAAAVGHDFRSLAPMLNQMFFIGDGTGLDASGSYRQQFTAPRGATRLYLGFTDYCSPGQGCFYDNAGHLDVRMTISGS